MSQAAATCLRKPPGVSPPSTVTASSGRRAQEPRSLPAPSPRPLTAPPSHRNSQPPPFFPSPSGLPPGINFEGSGTSRRQAARHSSPARTPGATRSLTRRLSPPQAAWATPRPRPSARRSRWSSEHLRAAWHGLRPSQATPPPASPQRFPNKPPAASQDTGSKRYGRLWL